MYQADGQTPIFSLPSLASSYELSNHEALLYTICTKLAEGDVMVESCHTEHSAGQVEFTFPPQLGMRTADNMFRFREAIKEICTANNIMPTFMAAPVFTDDGFNGCHLNFSLCREKDGVYENIVHAAGDQLSDLGRYFVGGVVAHFDALMAFYCPTVNCYRRLHSTFIPSGKDWGFDSRRVSLRVVRGGEHG